jgi:hypothetical protein
LIADRSSWGKKAMRLFAILGFACLACQPAAAISCDEVRTYVQTYGASVVLAYVKRIGATPQQIREGRACLRDGAKSDFRRSASREATTEQ